MKCPVCHTDNVDNLKFCTYCGTELKVHYCTTCGKELRPNKKFCENCGTPNPFFSLSTTSNNKNSSSAAMRLENEKNEVSSPIIPQPKNQTKAESNNINKSLKESPIIDKSTKTFNNQSTNTDLNIKQVVQDSKTIPNKTDRNFTIDNDTHNETPVPSEPKESLEVEETINHSPSRLWFTIIIVFAILSIGTALLGQRLKWWDIGIISWASGNINKTEDTSNNEEQTSDLMKALDVKGRAKTITYDGMCTFNFTYDGEYEGGSYKINEPYSLTAYEESGRIYITIGIENGRWSYIEKGVPTMVGTDVHFIDYDGIRPIKGNDNVIDAIVDISYSDFDNNGNWTKMIIKPDGREPYKITREITYWSSETPNESAATDISEAKAVELIKKANLHEEGSLSKEFKAACEKDHFGKDPFLKYGDYPDCVLVTNPDIKIFKILPENENQRVTVVFDFIDKDSPNMGWISNQEYDKKICAMDFIFESGEWVVDDFFEEWNATVDTFDKNNATSAKKNFNFKE